MTLALIAITLVYLYVIGRFVFVFDRVKNFDFKDVTPKTSFSLIIPFRNEAENLSSLLQSLSQLEYPSHLFEVVLVDDESTDDSIHSIKKTIDHSVISIKVINNIRGSNSPKKDAITTAMSHVKFDWIVTTDADCLFHKSWLATLNAFIQAKQPAMVVGPVSYTATNSFLHSFQTLDFLSLMGATIGGFGMHKPFLCNGANLAYRSDVFDRVNGFKGNDNIASGDDIFLMEKVLRLQPKGVQYLKHVDAIVMTKPQTSLPELISQRKRWAAKTSAYTNPFGKLVGAIVLLMNFSILAALFLSFFNVFHLKTIGYVFLIKFCIDLWLLQKTSQFFSQQKTLRYYLFCSVLYPFFNVYVALTSWFGGYTWKGRTFTK